MSDYMSELRAHHTEQDRQQDIQWLIEEYTRYLQKFDIHDIERIREGNSFDCPAK